MPESSAPAMSPPPRGLDNLRTQWVVGAVVHLLFVAILWVHPTSHANLQLPEGIYAGNIQACLDVMTYVRPARNFLAHGTFGTGDIPDYERTPGYEAFISLMIALGGEGWLLWALLVQAILSAALYPMLTAFIRRVLPDDPAIPRVAFVVALLSGAFITRLPLLLSDVFFTGALLLGMVAGAKGVRERSWSWLLVSVAAIGYASFVRVNLAMVALVQPLFIRAVEGNPYKRWDGTLRRMTIVSSLALLVVCNLTSVRNYAYHGFFAPSIVPSVGLFEYFGKRTMVAAGDESGWTTLKAEVTSAPSLTERLARQQRGAWTIAKTHPVEAVVVLGRNLAGVLFDNHWTNTVGSYFGLDWKAQNDPGCYEYERSQFLYVATIALMVPQAVALLLFLLFLWRAVHDGRTALALWLAAFAVYLLVPTSVAGGGSRLRMPVELILIPCAVSEVVRRMREWRVTRSGYVG